MANKFISIASFANAADAAIAQGLLESNGIQCRLFEERLLPNSPAYKGINGKTVVQVQRRALNMAMRILREKGHLRSEDFCASKMELLIAKILFRS